MNYFLDTNIISEIIKHNDNIISYIEKLTTEEDNLIIPIVSWYEIKRGLLSINSKKLDILEKISSELDISLMGFETFEIAANIYANLKNKGLLIEDADIFIAASTIEHNATLITRNIKHFNRIKGLKVLTIK